MGAFRLPIHVLLVFGCLAVAATAFAGAPRTHDGFFLRLSGGGGYASTSEDIGNTKIEVSGGAGDINLAIGGMVSPNFAIHATIFGWSMADPTVELTGFGSGELSGDLTCSAIGAGFTYYLMPSNVYLSASVGAATMELDLSGGPEFSSETGFAADFTLGKEWWSGDSWGLGVAGGIGVHSIPDEGTDESLSGASLGIRFTATLN